MWCWPYFSSAERDLAHRAAGSGFHRLREAIVAEDVVAGDGYRRSKQAQADGALELPSHLLEAAHVRHSDRSISSIRTADGVRGFQICEEWGGAEEGFDFLLGGDLCWREFSLQSF